MDRRTRGVFWDDPVISHFHAMRMQKEAIDSEAVLAAGSASAQMLAPKWGDDYNRRAVLVQPTF